MEVKAMLDEMRRGCGAGRRKEVSNQGRTAERMSVGTRMTMPGVVTESDARWRPWGRSPRRCPEGTSRTVRRVGGWVPRASAVVLGAALPAVVTGRSLDALAGVRCR